MALADPNKKFRWCVKDTVASDWRPLPGTYSTSEMLRMRIEGIFVAATPAEEAPATADESD
jgi:hypothetical protein